MMVMKRRREASGVRPSAFSTTSVKPLITATFCSAVRTPGGTYNSMTGAPKLPLAAARPGTGAMPAAAVAAAPRAAPRSELGARAGPAGNGGDAGAGRRARHEDRPAPLVCGVHDHSP